MSTTHEHPSTPLDAPDPLAVFDRPITHHFAAVAATAIGEVNGYNVQVDYLRDGDQPWTWNARVAPALRLRDQWWSYTSARSHDVPPVLAEYIADHHPGCRRDHVSPAHERLMAEVGARIPEQDRRAAALLDGFPELHAEGSTKARPHP